MLKMYRLLFVAILCFFTVHAKHEEVDGHSLYAVRVQNVQQIKLISDLAARLGLDIWRYATPGREGQILVPGHLKQAFQTELHQIGISYKIAIQNIKESLDLEEKLLAEAASKSQSLNGSLSFDVIHRYDVVDDYMVELAKQFPNLVTVESAGRSFEGRDIKYLKISTTNFQNTSKPVIMIQSLLHAREWITLPVSLYAIKRLVTDVTDQDLVNDVDWIILPIANPDGYEFSHTSNRMWRKNRGTGYFPFDICRGVDLNRNFGIFWGTASSNIPCSITFHGRHGFSEPETQAIRRVIQQYGDRMQMYLDIHSYGSIILHSYGNGQLPPNAVTVISVAERMARAIDAVKWPQNPDYVVFNLFDMITVPISGLSNDYVQSTGVPLSYMYELPAYRNHDDDNGFLVETEFIEQVGYESWEGIKAGARWVVANTRRKQMN